MKKIINFKNYICFILAFLMMITGIYLYETQMDSSFALRTQEPAAVILNEVSAVLQDAYALIESGPQTVFNSRNSGTVLYRVFRCGKIYDKNMQINEKQYAVIHFIQELDIRMCRTDNLTQIFNVLYIHHQDGVKGAGLFLL